MFEQGPPTRPRRYPPASEQADPLDLAIGVADRNRTSATVGDLVPHLVDLKGTVDHVGLGVSGCITEMIEGVYRGRRQVDGDAYQAVAAGRLGLVNGRATGGRAPGRLADG